MLRGYENLKSFVLKHGNLFSVVILALFCYLFLFFNLGAYPLIDIDETRYAFISKMMLISKDWVTPYLNGVPFLEKPPLYFWLTALSYKIFGLAGTFGARFSTALVGAFAVFFTYFFGKKALGHAFGLISAFILLTNVWFLLFSHVAILDLGFMVFTMATIYCTLLTMFCQEKNKKYCWWASYFFMALSVLSKGLIGIAIPVLVVFFSFLATGRLKEVFKPINWLVGLPIFLVVALPWHYLVWAQNGQVWFNEYIVKHHFARFVDSSLGLGRKQPFWFYLPILIGGFMPWTISLFAAITSGVKVIIKDFKSTKSIRPTFSTDTADKKILVTMSIYFILTFLFFSASSSKLPTYILAAIPPLTMLCGYYWWGYISYGKFTRGIVVSTILMSSLFIIAGIVGAVIPNFAALPMEIETFRLFSASWVIIMSLISVLCLLAKNRALLFVSNVIFMLGAIIIITTKVFTFITASGGQAELEKFTQKADSVSNSILVTYDFANKYSVLHNYSGKVHFLPDPEVENLDDVVKEATQEKSPVFVIIRKRNAESYGNKFKDYETVESGAKYIMFVKKLPN